MNMYDKAIDFIRIYHKDQKYGDKDYIFHLKEVFNILKRFYPKNHQLQIAGLLHDIIEDTDCTREILVKEFNYKIAELVFLVTDVDGKNRWERKQKTYLKTKINKEAIILKTADRIANVQNCIKYNNKRLARMYKKEFSGFKHHLEIEADIFKELVRLQDQLAKMSVEVIDEAKNFSIEKEDDNTEILWSYQRPYNVKSSKLVLPMPTKVLDDLNYIYWLPHPKNNNIPLKNKYHNKNNAIYCDIDDNLILDGDGSDDDIIFKVDGHFESRKINTRLVEYLKNHHSQGFEIILWSQRGGNWAWQVCEKLNLYHYVNYCLAKPKNIFCSWDWEKLLEKMPNTLFIK